MRRFETRTRSAAPRILGLALLVSATGIGHALVAIGIGRSGDEPPAAYGLALLVFLFASAGTALTALGPRLFGTVIVASRWQPHVPASFRETED